MEIQELKSLIDKANENFVKQQEENIKLAEQVNGIIVKFNDMQLQLKELIDSDGDQEAITKLNEQIEEALDQIADLELKAVHPSSNITDEQQQKAMQQVAMKAVGAFIKTKDNQQDFFEYVKNHAVEQCKTLNISSPETGGLAIAETLDRDVMDYARDFSPIVSQIGNKSSLTRDYRQLILVTYPSVAEGIENVAGTVPAETSTQTYVEIRASEFKVYASPRLTNEVLYGTDIDVYSDLIQLLGEQIGIYLAAQILYGNGQDKNCRGILSSNRLDITDSTGQSWLPTLTADGTGARPADFYPAVATGVTGEIAVNSSEVIKFVVETMAKLPNRYRSGAKWYMHEDTKTMFELVRNADEEPIFRPDYRTGDGFLLNGKPVVIDNTMPVLADDSAFAIYGDLSKAFAMSNGDINQMLLDPYTVKGCLIVYTEREYFEMVQRSDSILVCCATANSGA